MFEYHLHGVEDGDGPPFTHSGVTADFLELCCQIAKCFSTEIAGRFVQALLDKHNDKLDFLRIDAGWNFEGEFAEFPTPESSFIIKRIELRKVA